MASNKHTNSTQVNMNIKRSLTKLKKGGIKEYYYTKN